MSITVQSWVYQLSESRLADRLVLLAIADEADDDGTGSYPSLRRIARKARISVSTAQAAVARLEALGELEVTRPLVTGRGHHNTYRVIMAKVPDSEPLPPDKRSETFGNVRPRGSTDPLTHRPEDQPLALAPRTRQSDPLFEAVCEATGYDYHQLGTRSRGAVNAAVADIRAAGGEPGAVSTRAGALARRYPQAAVTPQSLAKHWASLGPAPGSSGTGSNGHKSEAVRDEEARASWAAAEAAYERTQL